MKRGGLGQIEQHPVVEIGHSVGAEVHRAAQHIDDHRAVGAETVDLHVLQGLCRGDFKHIDAVSVAGIEHQRAPGIDRRSRCQTVKPGGQAGQAGPQGVEIHALAEGPAALEQLRLVPVLVPGGVAPDRHRVAAARNPGCGIKVAARSHIAVEGAAVVAHEVATHRRITGNAAVGEAQIATHGQRGARQLVVIDGVAAFDIGVATDRHPALYV